KESTTNTQNALLSLDELLKSASQSSNEQQTTKPQEIPVSRDYVSKYLDPIEQEFKKLEVKDNEPKSDEAFGELALRKNEDKKSQQSTEKDPLDDAFSALAMRKSPRKQETDQNESDDEADILQMPTAPKQD